MKNPLPSRQVLRAILSYDPSSGDLRWLERPLEMFGSLRAQRAWNAKWAGKPAYYLIDGGGYANARMLGSRRRAHRVIWKWMTGEEPEIIDHINGVRSDNRWCNLRNTDQTGNMTNAARPKNNRSGSVGVWYCKRTSLWCAEIMHRGHKQWLGGFPEIESAIAARKGAEAELGFHPNHGRAPNLCGRYGEAVRG
jgi:hypothetical protein